MEPSRFKHPSKERDASLAHSTYRYLAALQIVSTLTQEFRTLALEMKSNPATTDWD
jgi:hypothetical protein